METIILDTVSEEESGDRLIEQDEEKEKASPAVQMLLRESRAESIRLLEESARTIGDWQDVIFEYDKRDENRMRRERRKEILRPDDYLEHGRKEHNEVIPVPYGNIPWRQLVCQ